MIDELYDNGVSLCNEIGYLDLVNGFKTEDYLRWSSNKIFQFDNIHIKREYPLCALSYDNFFRSPFSIVFSEDGTITNIY
jgi:hypothetical protein